MIVLSAGLEKLTGKPYGEAISVLVLRPARLEQTFYDDPARIVPNRARGYSLKDGITYNAGYIDMTLPSGAGGLISTTGDLARFTRAFVSSLLLPPPLTRDALTSKNSEFGYGWEISDKDNRREIWHIGDINGFGSFLAFYPDADVIAVALTNVEGTPIRSLIETVANSCVSAAP
jgi:CubicO group peptidase (beta-lactamase class C family)